jgi:hypothetical protein
MRKFVILGLFCFTSLQAGVTQQTINLPVDTLGSAVSEFSYVIGVGDLDGDDQMDYIVRLWSEAEDLKNDLETRTYAFNHTADFLWTFNHHITPKELGFEPCALVPMTIWDFDGDGQDEVVTMMRSGNDYILVMLSGGKGPAEIKYQAPLPEASSFIFSALAYLDGSNPYVVIATGTNARVIAFDRELQRYKTFDDAEYGAVHDCVWLLPFDFDNDGNDEIVHGPLLLNEDLSLYFDGTQFKQPKFGLSERAFVNDILPSNQGMEFLVHRHAGYKFGSEEFCRPRDWRGVYLFDVDQKSLIWQHFGDEENYIGWGRMHRGWLADLLPEKPGLESFATGQFWTGQSQWDNYTGRWRDKGETLFVFDAEGNINHQEEGTKVGYPVLWDDDPEPEYFRYRNGRLYDNFFSSSIIEQLADHNGSGECTIADIMGDWREEILITDNDGKLHIYSNEKPTEFPERPYLRDGHNYLMHLASIGSGLPKPVPPDPDLIPSKILEQGKLLDGFRLNQNYPNPFNNETTLEYTIPKPGNVDLAVYDIIGQKVGTIDSGFRGANTYKVTWNSERFGSGIYLFKLTYRNSIALRKIIFLK